MAAELKHRWKLAVAAKGRVAKKSSHPLPPRKRVLPQPPQPSASSSSSSPAASGPDFIKPGAYVRVRQAPVQISPAQRLVFVHRAVVASAPDNDGFVEVFFPEAPPHGVERFQIVRVGTHQIKGLVPPPPASSSSTSACGNRRFRLKFVYGGAAAAIAI